MSSTDSRSSDSATVFVSVEVEVTIHDSSVVDRVNDPEWRKAFYALNDENAVIAHLAANYVRNGIDKANRLEGWADVADDAVTFIERTTEVTNWEGDQIG